MIDYFRQQVKNMKTILAGILMIMIDYFRQQVKNMKTILAGTLMTYV